MQYTLVARKNAAHPVEVTVTQYGTSQGVHAALAYCERVFPSWDGYFSWEALACACENNGDYCEACEVFEQFKRS